MANTLALSSRFAVSAATLSLIAFFVACSSSTGQPSPLSDSGVTGSLEHALAELEELAPIADADQGMHDVLVNALGRQLTELGLEHIPAAVPATENSAVTDLRICDNGDGTAQCRFSYLSHGDYNQDSMVNISDLTEISAHYNKLAGADDWVRALLADGNSDGMVTISDLTPIAQSFNRVVDGYVLQVSDAVDGEWTDVDTIEFMDSAIPGAGGRRQFVYTLAEPELEKYYRVVPFHGEERGSIGDVVQYKGEAAATFTVSGICTNGAGDPLNGVEIALDGLPDVMSEADGSFEFADIQDGYSGVMTPSSTGLVFLPESWVVLVIDSDFGDISFNGFALDHLAAALPAEATAKETVTFEIRAMDAADNTLLGYDKQAIITVEPAMATVIEQPTFVNGFANASISFSEAGEYTVSISGLAPVVDGVISAIVISSPEVPAISIEKWRGGAEAALSLTFDDGTIDHWEKGMQLWDDYGFHVTLGILANRFQFGETRLPELQAAFDAGHELANHTTEHPDLTTLTDAQLQHEIDTCKQLLMDNVTGLNHVYSVIYPYEQFNSHVTDKLQEWGYFFARSGNQGIVDYAMPNNAWDPPLMHLYSWANVNTLPMWMWDSTTDVAISSGDWMIEQCHGIGYDGETGVGWSARPESEFRAHYNHIQSYGDRLWVAPLFEVGLYLVERNNAEIEVLSYSDQQLDFAVIDHLADEYYNAPLTITVEQPAGWGSITVRQGQTMLSVSKLETGLLRFDISPDAGIISVTRE